MPKLNDTQLILLSAAAQREDGSLYPLPDAVSAGAKLDKAIETLVGAAFAQQRETVDPATIRLTEGDIGYGVFITEIGLAAIGVDDVAPGDAVVAPAVTAKPERSTKAGAVLALLQRADGATLTELIEATGWLPHTTRAALTGLRKKGHAIERGKRGEVTCYTIVAA